MSKNKPSADYHPVPLSDMALAPTDSAAHLDDLDDQDHHDESRPLAGGSSSSSALHPESVPLTSSLASPTPRPDAAILHIADDTDQEDDDNEPLASAAGKSSSAAAAPRKVLASSADGVFANLSAKPEPTPAARVAAPGSNGADAPEAPAGANQTELPPSYEAAVSDPTPTYWDTTVFTTQLDDGEILVEGLPVGSSLTFVLSSMVSVAFQFVGFLMTYLLATSHAGRCGAKAGFGLTLLQYGMVVRNRVEIIEDGDNPFVDDDFNASLPPGTTPEERMAILDRTEWIAYLLMLLGWFLVIKSMFEYMRAKRLQALVMASPETLVA